ncbi:anthranilate phosphoribosyltransferase [Swingsia samuiensis]|uniref:Anthranilate phosphoribosyltransferase n=1 Tax=Swingsia samuiensis TaxID=1293412 RepID=A0A4Y6UN91_9PROT|nr:anthranilate phosphoribosyltransferase [Swingsia samuiensis]QDH17827.1 anthranilate phosphoribosyltransferase [Swingsia samuiensis]
MSLNPSFLELFHKVSRGEKLSLKEAEFSFSYIMEGRVEEPLLAAFLTALKVRGESTDELTGAVKAVRRYMTTLPYVPDGTIDVCGTGGDGLKTLNISTAVAFVLAGLGVQVAKHGNRALSSQSGATDVLEELGIPPSDDLALQSQRLSEYNLTFLAAPYHHPAMRYAAPVRKSLGIRTLFNLVGPLCNPAQVKHQLIGVYDAAWSEPVVRTLAALGSKKVWAVNSVTEEGGSDELTLAGQADVAAYENETFFHVSFDPELSGLPYAPVSAIRGGDAKENAMALLELLKGKSGPYRDVVLLNAAAALHVADLGNIIVDGRIDPKAFRNNVALAARSIDNGYALKALQNLRDSTSSSIHTNSGLS